MIHKINTQKFIQCAKFTTFELKYYCLYFRWLRCSATNRKVAGSIPACVIGIFHWHKILPIALWPWVRLSVWQKWVPGAFPESKGGRCVRLKTLPPSCAIFMKYGNLNFLEPSGPLQVCNETASTNNLRYFDHHFTKDITSQVPVFKLSPCSKCNLFLFG